MSLGWVCDVQISILEFLRFLQIPVPINRKTDEGKKASEDMRAISGSSAGSRVLYVGVPATGTLPEYSCFLSRKPASALVANGVRGSMSNFYGQP